WPQRNMSRSARGSAGYLTEIHFEDGQIVNEGDLLFVIDPRPYTATLAAVLRLLRTTAGDRSRGGWYCLAGRPQRRRQFRQPPVQRCPTMQPLAVCDATSVAFADFVPSDLVYRDRIGETYRVRYSPVHRWFYVPEMRSDEAVLIKCYDSAEDGTARFIAHSAFEDPTAPADVLPRESSAQILRLRDHQILRLRDHLRARTEVVRR